MRPLRLPSRTTRENAFSLIEMMVVLVIIGILTAIAVPLFTSQRQNNVDVDTQSAARELRQAADVLHLENASHPNSRVTMEAILGAHPEILKHAVPGTVLAIQSVDVPFAGYCITASNSKGNDFTDAHPYVLDSLHNDGFSACPAGVVSTGLPNQYVVNADHTITPQSTVNVCGDIKPGSIKQNARYDDGAGNFTPVSVDLVLSDDCSHVSGTVRVINATPGAVYTLPVYTQTMNPSNSPIAVTNTAYVTVTGTASAQVNLATGLSAGQNMKSIYFDQSYRTQSFTEAYLTWQQ